MKRIIVLLMLVILPITGCEEKVKEKKEYSKSLFTNVSWIRDTGNDIETIRFESDGGFSYSCGCGNSVNDSDLCEGYMYNEDTNEILLNCLDVTEEMVTIIKIIDVTEDVLELNFDGEIRKFEKEK